MPSWWLNYSRFSRHANKAVQGPAPSCRENVTRIGHTVEDNEREGQKYNQICKSHLSAELSAATVSRKCQYTYKKMRMGTTEA